MTDKNVRRWISAGSGALLYLALRVEFDMGMMEAAWAVALFCFWEVAEEFVKQVLVRLNARNTMP